MADAGIITAARSRTSEQSSKSSRDAIKALRRRMERAVERLLAALDALDGDTDLEPSLSSPESQVKQVAMRQAWSAGVSDDREEDAGDAREMDHDFEQLNEDGDDSSDGPVPNYRSHHDQTVSSGFQLVGAKGTY